MDVAQQQDPDSTVTTTVGKVLSGIRSPFDACEQCGKRIRLAGRKWCGRCARRWQRGLPVDEVEKFPGRLKDPCPDWRRVVPERYRPAELGHLPEALAERIRGLPDDRGLFLWGPQGAGKTYADAAALKYLWAEGWDIGWATFEEVLLRIRDSYKPGGGSEWDLLGPLCQVDALAIEDVGCGVSSDRQESDFSLRTFLVLLDHRLAHCRKTFITSNKSIEDVGRSFDGRIASRICEACDVVKIAGRDRRADRVKKGDRHE